MVLGAITDFADWQLRIMLLNAATRD